MASATIKAVFDRDIQTVWEVVTSLEHYAWRSDLARIEILDERRFVEHTKDGFATMFTVTACEPCRRWAFDIENENMTGRWTGLFGTENGKTVITFTEEVEAKKRLMKPFVGMYLKKQQAAYVADLKRALTG